MTASIREAKSKLSQLVESAERGEEVIITSNGKPRVKLVAVPSARRRGFNWERMRQLAEKGATGKKGPDATQIISELRADR